MTSGLRIGTPAITSRGFKEEDATKVASLITTLLTHADDPAVKATVKAEVNELTAKYPLA